ncbi:hypothetical protein ATK74_1758 [Propionicimonas paludicola]|uniref:HK97 family phage major capsid protein n=1 Tax=Propionicimonas paludicola TaxID=185243 RepID=A0A2A9CT19_9ACTN|nr:hypothetical protein [Propionicimonas paludicola]PFG17195.1 hypothetical protein ATK74_1758 [Propionicimonas paludicola]
MSTFPPGTVTISGTNLTASYFLSQPNFVARRLRELADLRYVGSNLLRGRAATTGGAVGYEVAGESIFADSAPEVVAPGGEYTLTTTGAGTPAVAKVSKYGKDSLVTDEDVKRRNMDPVNRGLNKLANSCGLIVDQAVGSAIASAVTATVAAAAKWNLSATETILLDVMLAQASITGQNLGYQPDTLLVSDVVWAWMTSNKGIAALMARENLNNPVYTGRFQNLAGLDVVHVPVANMPGGVGTNAWVLDTTNLGFIAKEDLGGGYLPAGDLVESKTIREDLNDGWRLRARVNFAAAVTDPLAGYKITTVA